MAGVSPNLKKVSVLILLALFFADLSDRVVGEGAPPFGSAWFPWRKTRPFPHIFNFQQSGKEWRTRFGTDKIR